MVYIDSDLEEIEMHDVSALTAYYVTLLCELESKAYFEESGERKEIYFSKEVLPGKTYQDTKFMIKEMENPIKA